MRRSSAWRSSASVNIDMSTDPDQIRDQVAALLAELPAAGEGTGDLADTDLEAIAMRLEEAHDVLVRALEAVEKG